MSVLSGLVAAKLITPALVIALSPVPIVVSLLLLVHNERPYRSSIAYLLRRLVSLGTLTFMFMRVPRSFDMLLQPAPRWADWATMAAGLVLVASGLRLWWVRRGSAAATGWEGSVGTITPSVAAGIGMFPMLANPKVLAASAAVGAEVAPCSGAAAVTAVAYYAILANSTVAAPILAYFVVGPRIDPRLERLRHWIQRRHREIMAVTLVIVGVAVMLYGLA